MSSAGAADAPTDAAAAANKADAAPAAAATAREKRTRKAKVFVDQQAAPMATDEAADEAEAEAVLAVASASAAAEAEADEASIPIEHYGLEVDKILAWRYKGGIVKHHNADGSISIGGDSKAPFEGSQQHLHIHAPKPDTAAPAAAAAASSSSAAAAAKPAAPAPKPPATAAGAAASAASLKKHTAASSSAASVKDASWTPSSASSSSTKKKKASSTKKESAKEEKARLKAEAKEGSGKKGQKRKETAAATAAGSAPNPAAATAAAAAAGLTTATPDKPGRGRRPKFTPVTKEDAVAAFQRTLQAAREASGLGAMPISGVYVSKKERLASKVDEERAAERAEEEEEEVSEAEEEEEAPAPAEDSSAAASSGAEEEGSGDEEAAAESASEEEEEEPTSRSSKRRKTLSKKKAAAQSAAASVKKAKASARASRKKKKEAAERRKQKKAGSKSGPSATAVRNALIAEHRDKEFFVIFKGRSYLHAKWVDIYAFLTPPRGRETEFAARPTPTVINVGLITDESVSVAGGEQNTATFTQLRVKLLRFLRSTPLPIPDDEELFLADFVEIDRILAQRQERVEESESDSDTEPLQGGKRRRPPHNTSARGAAGPEGSAASSRAGSPFAAAAAGSSSVAAASSSRSRVAKSAASSALKSRKSASTLATFYLIKWQGLPYSASTWEHSRFVHDDSKVREFETRQMIPSKSRPQLLGASSTAPRPPPSAWTDTGAKMLPDQMPLFKNGNELRPWQIDGVNWLNYNWYMKRGCILADEMGLGKTVQVVTHLLHLRSVYTRGPFLVVVPLSTLPHWKREFEAWSDLNSIIFQGSRADREMIKSFEWNFWTERGMQQYEGPNTPTTLVGTEFKFDVLLCTYESILSDATFLAKTPWKCIVVDEAHRLKNSDSRLFKALALFQMDHRLLMTGTPIQNNLDELWTLLHFVEPTTFPSLSDFQAQFGVLEKHDQVRALQQNLGPYMLRRLKEDVAKKIPPKEETLIQVELTLLQKQYYRAVYEKNRSFLYKGCDSGNVPHLLNIVMQLRKVCSHPFLLPGVEDKENAAAGATTSEQLLKTLVAASGKLVLIDKLLPKLHRTGHKVLIFSQMKMILDLLEFYMKLRGYNYERIDGSIRGNERQAAIDRFSKEGSDRFVFMLSTRAGGLGINLTAADTVIIYDSDWNPQNDMQAQARAHRIGQSKPVKIYRLVTRGTYEMDMFRRASMKLGLDQAVLKKSGLDVSSVERDAAAASSSSNALSALSKTEVESLLKNGAHALLDDANSELLSASFCEADIDEILNSRSTVIRSGGNEDADENAPREMSTFSQAVFASEEADSKIDVNDKDFWQKLLPDERSPAKLQEKLSSGAAYATKDAREEFMAHLRGHVEEISAEYQQGNSLAHVPVIIEILQRIATAAPPPLPATPAAAATAAAASPASTAAGASTAAEAVPSSSEPTPMETEEDEQKSAEATAATAAVSAASAAAAAAAAATDASTVPPDAAAASAVTAASPAVTADATPPAASSAAVPPPAPAAAAAAPSSDSLATPLIQGWTREQIRQCGEWCQELLKPRRQRKIAERYTDLQMNQPTGSGAAVLPSSSSGVQLIETAFKRRLFGRALNGMGGIVFNRKQRRSLSQTVLDMVGVLPFPKSASAAPGDHAPLVAPAPSVDAQMRVWYLLRAQLDPSLRERKLSELMGWVMSFVQLLISLSDAQDNPVYSGVLERFQACVPPAEALAVIEAAESKQRRKRERHNAIRKLLADQLRIKLAAQRRAETMSLKAEAAAAQATAPAVDASGTTATDGTDASAAPAVKSEPGSLAPTPQPFDDSSSSAAAAAAAPVKHESLDFLSTEIGIIDVADLLKTEGVGNTYSASGKRVGRPVTFQGGLSSDTATLIQMQPALLRPGVVPEITPEHLQDEYNDLQEHDENKEELDHYARFETRPLRASIAHFPSLSEDINFVKYLAKRCKRWARYMLLAQQLRGELDEFERSCAAEDKERPYINKVVSQFVSEAECKAAETNSDAEEDETNVVEGMLDEVPKAAAAAPTVPAAAALPAAATPSDSSSMVDVDSASSSAAAAAAAGAPAASSAVVQQSPLASLTPLQRKTLANLGRVSVSEVRSLPAPLLARILRRCVVRPSPSASDIAAHGMPLACLRLPSTLERVPAWWWTSADDRALLLGIAKYGVNFSKITQAPELGFKQKLESVLLEDAGGEEGAASDDDDDAEAGASKGGKGGSPSKKKGAKAAAAERQKLAAIKEEEAEAAAAAAAAAAPAASAASSSTAGHGCLCHQARYARNAGKTKVCTSCLCWFHLSCLEDSSKLKLENFPPLPAGHPLAAGLGSVAGLPGAEQVAVKAESAAVATGIKQEPLVRQNSNADAMDEGAAEDGDSSASSASDDEGDAGKSKKRRSTSKSAPSPSPSAASLRLDGFRCPRCSMSFPGPRPIELRLRVLADTLAKTRRARARAKDKLLRVLDERNYKPTAIVEPVVPSRARASAKDAAVAAAAAAAASAADSASSSAMVPVSSALLSSLSSWTLKDRREYLRALQMWGVAFFMRGGYHSGISLLEDVIRGGNHALAFTASNALLARKGDAQLRGYFEALVAQCIWLVEKRKRDAVIGQLRRKQNRLLAEQKELATAHERLLQIADKDQVHQSQYCFCRGAGVATRAAAASRSRKRRPNEFLIGCDDATSEACKSYGTWYHGLCFGIPNEASVPDSWSCPDCIKLKEQQQAEAAAAAAKQQEQQTETQTMADVEGADAASPAPGAAASAAAAPSSASSSAAAPAAAASSSSAAAAASSSADAEAARLADPPAAFDPLPLASLCADSSSEPLGGDDSGSDSDKDAPRSSSAAAITVPITAYSKLSLSDLEEEYTNRVRFFAHDLAQLQAEFQSLREVVPKIILHKPSVLVDESLGPHVAAKILARVNLLYALQRGLSVGAEAVLTLLHTLAATSKAAPQATTASGAATKMPEWWHPPVHDWAVLRAIFKHGIGAVDAMLADPTFSSAWHPSLDEAYVHHIVNQSSGAKVVLRKEIERFWPAFLQDRNPLIKRLQVLAAWLGGTEGAANKANASTSLAALAAGSPSALVLSLAGRVVDPSQARAPKMPLVAILDAKISGVLPEEDEDAAMIDGAAGPTASAASTPQKKSGKKKVYATYEPVVEGSSHESKVLAAARELALKDSNEKRVRSSSKRKMDAEADAAAVQELTAAQRAMRQPGLTGKNGKGRPSLTAPGLLSDSGSDDDATDEAGASSKPAKKARRKSASKSEAVLAAVSAMDEDDEDGGAAGGGAGSKKKKRASGAGSRIKPPGVSSDVLLVTRVDQVSRDPSTGALLAPFNIKTGLRICNLGTIHPGPAFRKAASYFPLGFESHKFYHSVAKPGTKTWYRSRIELEPATGAAVGAAAAPSADAAATGIESPLFTVVADDDPSTVWSGVTASSAWSQIAAASYTARGATEGKQSVSGQEFFGLSNAVVKQLIGALPGAQQWTPPQQQQHSPQLVSAAPGGGSTYASSSSSMQHKRSVANAAAAVAAAAAAAAAEGGAAQYHATLSGMPAAAATMPTAPLTATTLSRASHTPSASAATASAASAQPGYGGMVATPAMMSEMLNYFAMMQQAQMHAMSSNPQFMAAMQQQQAAAMAQQPTQAAVVTATVATPATQVADSTPPAAPAATAADTPAPNAGSA